MDTAEAHDGASVGRLVDQPAGVRGSRKRQVADIASAPAGCSLPGAAETCQHLGRSVGEHFERCLLCQQWRYIGGNWQPPDRRLPYAPE
jgi:hypothetical protein